MNSNFWGAIGSIISLLTFILTFLVEPIRQFLNEHTVLIPFVYFVIGALFAIFIFFLVNRGNGVNSIVRLRNRNSDLKRYSIVIVDDVFENQNKKIFFEKRLSNFNVCLLSEVNDVRLLTGFDIIVLDIMGATSFFKDTGSILRELYQSYPQKYLIAISQSNSALRDNKAYIDNSIQKNSGKNRDEDLTEALSNLFMEVFPVLDNPNEHWKSIEKKIQKEPLKRKEVAKNSFSHMVLSNPSYS